MNDGHRDLCCNLLVLIGICVCTGHISVKKQCMLRGSTMIKNSSSHLKADAGRRSGTPWITRSSTMLYIRYVGIHALENMFSRP